MFGILGLGFLLGMQHALEADHVAAVSSIAARRSEVTDIVKHGLTWGLGHTLTLFIFAGAAILLGRAIPDTVAQPIETAVGVMLVGLGAHVLWRLWRDRVHFHRHGHADGTELSVGVRPQGVGFTLAGDGVPGRIVGHQFLGEVDLLSVAIDGADRPIRVRTRDNAKPFIVGSTVWLTVDPREVLVFAKQAE